MTHLFTFLRHGESIGNQKRVIQGQQDFPLSPVGINQAQNLGQKWQAQDLKFDAIISSSLIRARKTAEIIQSYLPSPLVVEDIWKERAYGTLESSPLVDEKGEPALPASLSIYEPLGETGESEWQLYLRAGNAVQSLFKYPPGNYLIVAHGGLLNKTLSLIAGTKPEADYHGHHFIHGNTGYTNIVYDSDRNEWQFRALVQPEFPFMMHGRNTGILQYFLIRHAESEGNINQIFQGQMDTELTPTGEVQASSLSNFFSDNNHALKFNQIITSPLLRAKKTAEKLQSALGIPLSEIDLLKEVNNGDMVGLTGEEINQKFPERLDRVNPYLPIGISGESWFELFLRGGRIIDHLLTQPGGSYLVVSHGAILNSIIWAVLGLVPQPGKRPPVFRFKNTSFAELVYSPEEKSWQILSLASPQDYSSGLNVEQR
jgi:broad specificity phosphatase PhoE